MASKEKKMKKGLWSSEEDDILREYVSEHGEGKWHLIEENSILPRSGKSCRLRWLDHLRPDLKKVPMTTEEEELLIELHKKLGNKWSQIAKHFPGRTTDNELKNFWHKLIRRGRGTDQNHQQQIDPNIISNSTAADKDQTGCSSQRQKCYRNSTCLEAFDLFALEFEWPNMDEDSFDSFEFDVGKFTFPDLSLGNSVAGFEDEHALSHIHELLEETWLNESYLAATCNFMSEDEIATPLKPDFYHEFEMQLSETFESHSGDTAKEALSITTMEESLEQIFSSRSWIEIFPAGYLAVDNGLGTHFNTK